MKDGSTVNQMEVQNGLESFVKSHNLCFHKIDVEEDLIDFDTISLSESEILALPFQKITKGLSSYLTIGALLKRQKTNLTLYIKNESLDDSQDLKIKPKARFYSDIPINSYQILNIREDLCVVHNVSDADALLVESSVANLDGYTTLNLHPSEIIPQISAGITAIICNTDDISTRQKVKILHDAECCSCSNVERTLANYLHDVNDKAIHCYIDKQKNFQLHIALIDSSGSLIKEKISQSTSYKLAEAMYQKIKKIPI
jgi:hypothetical protein